MKGKTKTIFRCQECGYSSSKWMGKCTECGKWNSFAEEKETRQLDSKSRSLTNFSSDVVLISDISTENYNRLITGISEFDRILGGGIAPHSLVLLGGAPGIGKSTLMLQVADAVSKKSRVLYVSGEESLAQIKNRADRLKVKSSDIFLLSETNLENILNAITKVEPEVLVIDSIQTMYRGDLAGAPGSVGQVRECAAELLRIAKSKNITVFLLGHVTKEGDLAGPRVLEHIVDTVLYFETERQQVYRVLRAYKNRFGPTNEIGVFEMKSGGLSEVKNPSEIFLGERMMNIPGSAVVSTIEGTRPILLEVQSLVSRTTFGMPRRMVTGYDLNRVTILIAVLEKRFGLKLDSADVFVNVVGGVKIKETGVDLGVACAIASAFMNMVCPAESVFLGEVGLAGEVRSITQISERITEAEKLGFKKAVVPKSNLKNIVYNGKIKIIGVTTLKEAIEQIERQ